MREGSHAAIRVDEFSRRLYSRRLRSTRLKRIAVVVGILEVTGLVGAAGGPSAQRPSAQRLTYGIWGVDLAGMDNGVKPGDDFFDYANGTWYEESVIPPDRLEIGASLDTRIRSEQRMSAIVKEFEAKPLAQLTGEQRKVRDLYDAYTNNAAIEENGLTPAKKDLVAIAGLRTLDDVARAMGNPAVPLDGPFDLAVSVDAKQPSRYLATLTQSGLGMPNRDYYLKGDPVLATTRDAYRTYLTAMLTLAGEQNADARAGAVFTLETQIAKDQWTVVESRDAGRIYNPITETKLASYGPGFPWATYLSARGLSGKGPSGDRILIVRQNTAFPEVAKLFAATPVRVWRDYLTVHYLHSMSDYLPKAFAEADFNFFGRVLGGTATRLPRETRAVHLIDQRLGHPLGKLYVAKYLPPESRAKVEALVGNLLKAYDADIRTISWMTDATKAKALDKLHHITAHVGYPDVWRDFSGLAITRDDLIGDIERSNFFEWHYRLDRIDRPVDRDEWNRSPPRRSTPITRRR